MRRLRSPHDWQVAFMGLTAAAASEEPHNLDVVEGIGRDSDRYSDVTPTLSAVTTSYVEGVGRYS